MNRLLIIILMALAVLPAAVFLAAPVNGEMSIEIKRGAADFIDGKIYTIYSIRAEENIEAKVTVIMPEQGIRGNSRNIEVGIGDTASGIVCLDNDLKPGQYLIRVVVSSDNFKRVKHRIIEVI